MSEQTNPSPDAQRFASYVNVTSTCHLWTGKLDRDGYGLFWYQGKWMPAHVYAFEQEYGPVPEGHEVDHVLRNGCTNRNCVNAKEHLEAVTHAVNLARRSDRQAPVSPLTHVIDKKTGTALDPSTGTVYELREPNTGRFVKGHAPLAGGGRPKKGERLLDYANRLVEKAQNKQAVAEAHLDRLLRRDAVGARAFADHRDTFFGIPKQTLVLEQADSPLAALLTSISEAGGMRQLPAGDETQT